MDNDFVQHWTPVPKSTLSTLSASRNVSPVASQAVDAPALGRYPKPRLFLSLGWLHGDLAFVVPMGNRYREEGGRCISLHDLGLDRPPRPTTSLAVSYAKVDTAVKDRVCSPCATCNSTQYRRSDCTATTNTVCEALAICRRGEQYQSEYPTASSNRVSCKCIRPVVPSVTLVLD